MKVQETGISLQWGTAGEPGGGLIYWGLRNTDKGGVKRYVKEGSGNGQISLWAPLENLEEGSFTGEFEIQ